MAKLEQPTFLVSSILSHVLLFFGVIRLVHKPAAAAVVALVVAGVVVTC